MLMDNGSTKILTVDQSTYPKIPTIAKYSSTKNHYLKEVDQLIQEHQDQQCRFNNLTFSADLKCMD